jgi:hypothetical protein
MKKQFQILAATFITVAFISCSKEKAEMTETPITANEEIATGSSSSRPNVDPLTIDLDGRYTFDKHLKDVTRQQADGKASPIIRGVPIYTYDRKGIANAALKFDGNYYVTIPDVPVQQNMSVSVWVKRSAVYPASAPPSIIRHNSTGISLMQDEDAFWARVLCYTTSETSSISSNDFIDQAWHHIVITYAADEMTMYVDGQLQTKSSNVFTVTDVMTKYSLGYAHGNAGAFWKGIIDDLRYYGRTLTATDVQQLFNQ